MFKYLFLIFAEKEDMTIDPDKYVFTTEAHLLPLTLSSFSNHTDGIKVEVRFSKFFYLSVKNGVLKMRFLKSKTCQNRPQNQSQITRVSIWMAIRLRVV